MRPRRLLSVLLATLMVVMSFSSAVLAYGDAITFTLPTGLTIALPSEYDTIWYGMSDDDPLFEEDIGVDHSFTVDMYEEGGIELQGNYQFEEDTDHFLFVMCEEVEAPDTLDDDTFLGIFADNGANLGMETGGTLDLEEDIDGDIRYGTIEAGGMTLYKVSGDIVTDECFFKCTQYYLITESGKMHTITAFLMSEPESDPFTDEELEFLDYTKDCIESYIAFDGATVSIDAEPYVSADGATAPDTEMTTYTTLTGLTVDVPSDFSIMWDAMSEDDPTFEYVSIDHDEVVDRYRNFGVELQGGYLPQENTNGQQYLITIQELDAPATIDEETLLTDFRDGVTEWCGGTPSGFDLEEYADGLYGYGTVEAGDNTLFHITYQIDETLHISLRTYYLFTDSGKMYKIELVFLDANHTGDPFSEEDLAYLDAAAGEIAASLSYKGDTISPQLPPFKMVVGDVSAGEIVSTDASVDPAPVKEPSTTFFKSFTEFEFPVWILAGALVLMFLIGTKVNKKLDWQEEPLALDTSKCIQGFAAVAIIFHHMTQDLMDRSGPLMFLSECGVLFVGVFFFFSGYGLYTSLKTKQDYLKGFLKKRFVTVLIPFYMCNFVFVIAECIGGAKFEGKELFYVLSGWYLLNTHMWYIVEIAILYIVFFILYGLIKNRTVATVLMSAFVLGMMYFSLQLAHGEDFSCRYWFMGEWWYNASFLFVVGIIVSKHADAFRKIARKIYWVLVPVLGVLVWFLGKRTHHLLETVSYWSEEPGGDPAITDKLLCLSAQLPWILCFVLLVLLIMMKIRFGNPVLKFLGSISLELYLIHNLFLRGLADGSIFKVKSASMYMLLTVLMAIGFATIISGVDKYLVALITGRKKGDLALTSTDRIHSIDVMRIVMAFFVVTIHLPFTGKAGDVFVTFGKTAVPFFLVVCGYFLFREDNAEMMKRLIKQTKRMFVFYVLANIFYAGMFALMSWKMEGSLASFKACFEKKPLMDFLLYNFSPFSEHLWYLGSLLYALLIMLFLNKLKVLKHVMFISPALIAAYVVMAHMGIGEFYQLRNALFIGLGYTMTGMLIRRYEKKILSIKHLGIILPLLFVACTVAGIYELNHYEQGTGVPFIGCEIMTYVIVLLCLRFPNFGIDTFAEKFGRDCSLPVYIMHIAVMMLFMMTSFSKFFGNYGAVTVFVVTAAIAGAYVSIKKAIIATGREDKAQVPGSSEVAAERS
ncbi:MAG: acyltransferase [Saccharofermentans sp.]|nr:acyltransferase [Saccharofermentans sp.]